MAVRLYVDVTRIAAASFVIGVLDVLADILPGEEGLETGDFGLVVANLEDQVWDADRLCSSSIGKIDGGLQL